MQKMILNRAHVLLRDDRSDLRIKQSGRIPWQIKYKKREGIAKIHNISLSGMLIETRSSFDPKNECIFSFDSDESNDLYIPQVGRLVWHKKKKFSRQKYLCGIKFLEADEKILTHMRSRVQDGVDRFIKKRRITSTAGLTVGVVIIAMIGALIWFSSDIYRDITTSNRQMLGVSNEQVALSHSFNNLYRANEIKLAATTDQLHIANQLVAEERAAIALYAQELEATKALLSQTEDMLISANDYNAQLNDRIDTMSAYGDVPLDGGGIMSVADAMSLMTTYRERIVSIKGEIKRLKSDDRAVRAVALASIDDQMLEVGNNGYFIREGQSVEVNQAQYQSLVDQSYNLFTPAVNQNIAIDVTFFE